MLVNPTIHLLSTRKPSPLDQAIARFHEDLVYRRRAPKTLEFYTFTLGGFAWWLTTEGLPLDPARLTADHIKRFLVYVRTATDRWGCDRPNTKRGASAATERSYAVALRAFFNWLVADTYDLPDGLKLNPMTGPVPARPRVPLPHVPKPQIVPFTRPQVEALLAQCAPGTVIGARNAALLYFLLDTGVRAGEACGLRLADYDLENGQGKLLGGKGHGWRYISLSPPARKALAVWLVHYRPLYGPTPDTVFLGLRQQGAAPLTPNGITQIIRQLGRDAGITGVRCSAHTVRRTFALWFVLDGGPLADLQLILDHATVQQTMDYVQASEAQKAQLHHRHAPAAQLDQAAITRGRRAAPPPTARASRPPALPVVRTVRCQACDALIPPERLRTHPKQRFCDSACFQTWRTNNKK